jgi:hypothetical protein
MRNTLLQLDIVGVDMLVLVLSVDGVVVDYEKS